MKKFTALILAAVLLLGLTACGSGSKKEVVEDISFNYAVDQAYSGSVSIEAPDLALELLNTAAEGYTALQSGVQVTAESSGHDAAINRFINKEVDILVLSADTTQEQDTAIVEAYGDGQAVQLRFATDGIVMIVSKDNDFVDYISKEEILAIYTSGKTAENDTFTWSQIRDGWPEKQVVACGTGAEDDLNCYFKKLVMQENEYISTLQEYATQEELIETVAANPNAIAFVSLSAYLRNADKVTGLAVDFGKGAKEPTVENIVGSGSIMGPYAQFSFPIYLYVSKTNAKENGQVFDFIHYLLSDSGAAKLAEELGYVPLTQDDYVNQIGTLAY